MTFCDLLHKGTNFSLVKNVVKCGNIFIGRACLKPGGPATSGFGKQCAFRSGLYLSKL